MTNAPNGKSTDESFVEHFRTMRTARGISQEFVASEMSARGFSFHVTTVGKIERGDRKVSVGEAVALAGVLGVDLPSLLDKRDALARAYSRIGQHRSEFVNRMAMYVEAMLDVAVEADKVDQLRDQDKKWIEDGLLKQTPFDLSSDAALAAQAAISRNKFDESGHYVRALLAALAGTSDAKSDG